MGQGQVQSTRIAALPGIGAYGQPSYVKRSVETPAERKIRITNDEIKEMAERLSVDHSVIVSTQSSFLTCF